MKEVPTWGAFSSMQLQIFVQRQVLLHAFLYLFLLSLIVFGLLEGSVPVFVTSLLPSQMTFSVNADLNNSGSIVDNAVTFLFAFYTVFAFQILKSLGERKGDPQTQIIRKFIIQHYSCTFSERPIFRALWSLNLEVLLTVHYHEVAQVAKSMCGV